MGGPGRGRLHAAIFRSVEKYKSFPCAGGQIPMPAVGSFSEAAGRISAKDRSFRSVLENPPAQTHPDSIILQASPKEFPDGSVP